MGSINKWISETFAINQSDLYNTDLTTFFNTRTNITSAQNICSAASSTCNDFQTNAYQSLEALKQYYSPGCNNYMRYASDLVSGSNYMGQAGTFIPLITYLNQANQYLTNFLQEFNHLPPPPST